MTGSSFALPRAPQVLCRALRDATPVDYYTVMCELEDQVREEFDFRLEAAAMTRVRASITNNNRGGRVTPLHWV